MTIIYGIDTDKRVNSSDVRDAIVECFTQAHSEALADLENYIEGLSKSDFEEMKRINIRQMIRNYFEEVGGSYDNPTRDSILKVMGKLKEFAENFRDKEMIDKHFKEISILVEKL
ncbi:MAG TPA: hypothetical protein VIK86_00525 [Candidatus Paceibacterota bacterium]